MAIRINNFGGPVVWMLRKHCSEFTSRIMLEAVSKRYSKNTDKFIRSFLEQEEPPMFRNVMIETINRCNGSCEFCPANKNAESRPFKRMADDMYHGIIDELSRIGWKGKLFLCVNNEPFIDNRIMDFSRYAKSVIPQVSIAMISNGTLLTVEKLDEMVGVVDQLTINDYSDKYVLTEGISAIYKYIRKHSDKFSGMNIVINRRYDKEILATRAGNAPNKKKKNVKVNTACLYPFTDLIIFPDGQVGMCCNDCMEVSHFGDISKDNLLDIWKNEKFQLLRKAVSTSREKYGFCKECDVIDAGEREEYIKRWLEERS